MVQRDSIEIGLIHIIQGPLKKSNFLHNKHLFSDLQNGF